MDAIRLVRVRGELMQNAVPEGEGAMCAVIKLDADIIERVIEPIRDETIAACLRANGGSVAYPTELKEVSGEDVGILLKGPEKKDLFYFLKSGQLFPRHTLTIGEENKRFHLEGREISYD